MQKIRTFLVISRYAADEFNVSSKLRSSWYAMASRVGLKVYAGTFRNLKFHFSCCLQMGNQIFKLRTFPA